MDDWDTVTKIGSKTRGPGSGPRETVVRGKSALNAAQRSGGIIATEKKYSTGNSSFSKTSSQQGQRDTKVDRSTDIVKPNLVGIDLGRVIQQARDALQPKVDRKEFARLIGENENTVKAYENGLAVRNQGILIKMERRLKVKLTGTNIGAPIEDKPKKKDAAAGAAAKKDAKK